MSSIAWAQTAAAPAAPAGASFIPLILIVVVFYFLLIRPQQKRMKEHETMIGNLRRGDKIVTGGGLIGTVHKVTDDEQLVVEIAENVRVNVMRRTISSVLSKPEPANDTENTKKTKAKK